MSVYVWFISSGLIAVFLLERLWWEFYLRRSSVARYHSQSDTNSGIQAYVPNSQLSGIHPEGD